MIDIKKNDFIKYRKCIYLVKDFRKLENGKYRLTYFFRTINDKSAKLYLNEFTDNYDWNFEYIKEANQEQINLLISKIRKEYPDFDLSFAKVDLMKNEKNMSEEGCIEYLKSKGYFILKQV
nr:hypothetical protein [uncultured Draconibacterium sp.]